MGRVEREPEPTPIARLLAMSYRWMIDELHRRLRAEGWLDIRPSFGHVLLAVRQQSITQTTLAADLGVTKQAASHLVDVMVERNLLTRTSNTDDARQRIVALAPRGTDLLTAVERIYVDLEHEWASVIGAVELDRLRAGLVGVLRATHDGELPRVIRPAP
jgi:DNA-binding MarR family transcriptional regulator